MSRALGTVAALALLGAACTSTPSITGVATGSPTSSASRAQTNGDVFARRCDTAVYGDLGANWRSEATNLGRLHMLYPNRYEQAPDSYFHHPPGRLVPLKILAVVDEGRPVVAWVPAKLRRGMGLVYDPGLFNGRLPPDAYDGVVRFVPCPGLHPTQFNGGIAVAGPGCYPLMVRSDGQVGKLLLTLGAPCD